MRIRSANLAAAFFLPLVAVQGAVPEWLRAVIPAPLPSYPPKTNAVVWPDERVITVKDSSDIRISHRLAVKILRPEGKEYGAFSVSFNNDTRLSYVRAWSYPVGQPEYEVKEKEGVETGFSG